MSTYTNIHLSPLFWYDIIKQSNEVFYVVFSIFDCNYIINSVETSWFGDILNIDIS